MQRECPIRGAAFLISIVIAKHGDMIVKDKGGSLDPSCAHEYCAWWDDEAGRCGIIYGGETNGTKKGN